MSRCKQDMLDAGETIVPRTCPAHGIRRCRPIVAVPVAPPLAPYDPNVRKGDWMQTASGRQFWPLDPRPEEIYIRDIAAALSKLCRYGGHVLRFYSVAEHCVHVASAAPAPLKLPALLHDASEAYLQDVIRPIKRHLTNYEAIEAELERAIAVRFGLAWPWHPEVKRLDNAILADERDQAMAPPPVDWKLSEPALGVQLNFWPPEIAEQAFLRAFIEYGGVF